MKNKIKVSKEFNYFNQQELFIYAFEQRFLAASLRLFKDEEKANNDFEQLYFYWEKIVKLSLKVRSLKNELSFADCWNVCSKLLIFANQYCLSLENCEIEKVNEFQARIKKELDN